MTTETERLLAAAREMTLRVHGTVPDELLLEVFRRLCAEADLALGDGAEAVH